MPFEIGRAFSPEAIAAVQRKQEADRQFMLDQQRMAIARHQELGSGRDTQARLDIARQQLAGEGEDRSLRRDVTQQEHQMSVERMNRAALEADRDNSFREKAFSSGEGWKGKEYDLNKAAEERQSQAQEDTVIDRRNQYNLNARELGLRTAKQKWEQETEFPKTVELKNLELQRKTAADEDRALYLSAMGENLKARTAETQGKASERLQKAGISSYNAQVGYLRTLTQQLTTETSSDNAYPNEEKIREIRSKIARVMQDIEQVDPGAAGAIKKQMGPEIHRAFGSPLGTEGYGAAGSFLDSMDPAAQGKPPAVPAMK